MSLDDHWLFRFTSAQWLAAARNELASAHEARGRRRSCLTHARRSAGMALNGALVHVAASTREPQLDVEAAASVWGRSYIDHLRGLAAQAPLLGLDPALRQHCEVLVKTPVMGPQGDRKLIQLRPKGADDVEKALESAQQVSAICTVAVEGS